MTAAPLVPYVHARYPGVCLCGLTIKVGDPVHRLFRPGQRTAWVHAACAAVAYAALGTGPAAGPLPCGHRAVYQRGPRAGECRACARSGVVHDQVPAPPSSLPHRVVNGAGMRCETCDGRMIVGRDGAPIPGSLPGSYRHPKCPPNRRAR